MTSLESIEIKCIQHIDIDDMLLNEIAAVKKQHWDYPVEEQLRWIKENINDSDYHIMIFNNDKILIGYMNLVNIHLGVDNSINDVIGIGNVCIDKNYMKIKLGKLLMDVCYFYLNYFKKPGVLLCKEHLQDFYKNVGWKQYFGNVFISGEKMNCLTFFNDDRFLNIGLINIDKSF